MSVIHGDCLAVMPTMDAESVDAIVCDPPYGLGFMGKDWDHGIPGVAFWREALRVAKPGAHLVAFGGTRTFHRLACGIEDAGWEIRDTLMWLYGSGFPKSLDVSKAMDKAAGEQRERIRGVRSGVVAATYAQDEWSREFKDSVLSPEPITDLARQWDGWGTALKPAWEPIILARKPLAGTVASNVAAHGTGAINVDACRIGCDSRPARKSVDKGLARAAYEGGAANGGGSLAVGETSLGRWPANVVLSHSPECREAGTRRVKGVQRAAGSPGFGPDREDGYQHGTGREHAPDTEATVWECAPDCAVALLDAQSGERGGGFGVRGGRGSTENYRMHHETGQTVGYGDTGGASRFFYCAKSSRREREAGLEGMPEKRSDYRPNDPDENSLQTRLHGSRSHANGHPTVKPLALMRWLCRLVTPPGGLILDPFCGSGSTGCAAALEGFRFVGVEQDAAYCEIARRRLAHWSATVQPELGAA